MMLDTKRLYRMARHLAYTKALHECPEQVAQDLQQAAWLVYLKQNEHKFIWRAMEYAMLEELSRWNYGCKRGRSQSRNMRVKVQLKDWKPPLDTLSPERLMVMKDALARELLLSKQREYNKKRKKAASTDESRKYFREYRAWVRAGRNPEDDPRFRKGHVGKARKYKLTTRMPAVGGTLKDPRLYQILTQS